MIRILFRRFTIIHFFFLAELVLTMLLNVILGNVYRDSMKDYVRLDEFKHQGIYFSTFSDNNMNGSFRQIRKQIEALPSFEGWSNTTLSSTITAEPNDSSDMATNTTADDANHNADETASDNPNDSPDETASDNPNDSVDETAPDNPTDSADETASDNPNDSVDETASDNPNGSANETASDNPNGSANETVPKDIIISIDKLSSQLFPMEAMRGKWFAEKTSAPRECIPCVMADNPLRDCDVGDTLEMDGKKFYVTGIISSDLSYFDIMGEYGNSDKMVLSDFVNTPLPQNYRTVLCSGALPEKYPDQTSVIAYFHPDAPQGELAKAKEILDTQGVTETFEEMKEATYRQCYQEVMQYFPFAMIFAVISVLSILAITIIDSRYILHCYGIYAICGCRFRTILGRYFRTILLLALLAMALVYLFIWGITANASLYDFFQSRGLESLHYIREGAITPADLLGSGALCIAYAGIAGLVLLAIKGRNGILDCMKFRS